MALLYLKQKGDFSKTESYLERIGSAIKMKELEHYGRVGVNELTKATPRNTGKTANSWSYEIKITDKSRGIYWKNSNVNNGVPIAIILQYGHGTGTGGYVQGIDYINPALKPIFEDILQKIWKEVKHV